MSSLEMQKTIATLLEGRLKPLTGPEKSLNLVACIEIYSTIFDTLVETLVEANIHITNEAMNYLSQQYYDSILVNGTQELDPEIFTQRAKLEEIETKELAIIAVILSGSDFAMPVIQEIKKRS